MLLALTGLLTTSDKTAPAKFPMTIESIMRGYALVGHAPRGLRWSEDGKKLTFTWAKADGTQNPPAKSYVVNADGTGLEPGSFSAPPRPVWQGGSRLGYEVAYESNGDIFLYNTIDDTKQQLTETSDYESNPIYARDGLSILFQKSGNLFRMSMLDHKVKQVTQVKAAGTTAEVPVTIEPPKGFFAGFLNTSPSGTHSAMVFNQPAGGTAKNAQVARFIGASSYVELMPTYARVGAPQNHSRMGIYNLESGQMSEFVPPRAGTVGQIRWAPDGKHGVAWGFSEDHKDAWLFGFDTATDKASILYTEHDNGWVGGAFNSTLGWLPDSSKFYFISENSGFANLYEMGFGEDKATNITSGSFEVSNVSLDEDHNRFLFVSSEGSPQDRHLDAVSIDGGPRRKLADLSADDDSSFAVSPDGRKVAVVRSRTNHPGELFVNDVQVTETPTKEWLSGPWIDAPVISVPARDGMMVPAKLYKPKNWRRGGPAVVFVHGAGYLQNVFHGWSYYYREYMFHHILMDRGYTVLDIDYRASAGYGKAWRTAIYRHMGGKDLDDVVDGAKYLVKELGAAPDRLGVYGGSYGGFITFMAMFTAPNVFKSGAALRPVGDWANYHHGYTSPILNTPQEDPEAYKVSSPINFVEGLKGNLLICHGMVDVNVQFQDSVRVVEKLIELGKKNWSVTPYPVEDHGFVKPESWTDEYNRIFDLFERTIGNKRQR